MMQSFGEKRHSLLRNGFLQLFDLFVMELPLYLFVFNAKLLTYRPQLTMTSLMGAPIDLLDVNTYMQRHFEVSEIKEKVRLKGLLARQTKVISIGDSHFKFPSSSRLALELTLLYG